MLQCNEEVFVNQKAYRIIKLLGHGKGGYSYLAKKDGKEYVLKQIHHEPCSYYKFGNKIQSEINDYDGAIENFEQAIKLSSEKIKLYRVLFAVKFERFMMRIINKIFR